MSDKKNSIINGLPNNDEVIARARAVFGSACENADSYHTLRLGLARRKALNAGATPRLAGFWAALGGTAVACCALAIGVVLVRPAVPTVSPAGIASSAPIAAGNAEDTDELPEVGSSQMEMVQDLDFYRWLAAQPRVASGRSRGAR